MKVLIFKSGHGEYDDYYETNDHVLLIPNDHELTEDILEKENEGFRDIFLNNLTMWREAKYDGDKRKGTAKRFYETNPKKLWSFNYYIIDKYNLTDLNFIEHYHY